MTETTTDRHPWDTKEGFEADLISSAKKRVADYMRQRINAGRSKNEGEAAYQSFGFLCMMLDEARNAKD